MEEIRKALYDWAVAALAGELTIPVRWARQNAPRPARPYLLLDARTVAPVSEVEIGPVDDDGIRTIGKHQEILVALEAYAVPHDPYTGTDICQTLLISLEKVATRLAFQAAGFCFVDVLAITDLSALRDTQFEGRAQMDIRLRTFMSDTEEVGYISAVELDAEVDGIESTDMIGTPFEEPEPEPEPEPDP